jgi:amino acid transporter
MNFGSVVVKALVTVVVLFLLSLAGAITFPVLAVITSGTNVAIISILLFLLAMLLLALLGTLIARGIKSVKRTFEAILLAFVGALFLGAILAVFALLNIPYTIRVNLNWLGTAWYAPLLSLLFIGAPLMLVYD